MQLGNRIFNRFKELHMDPWSHTHNVLLPEPDRFILHSSVASASLSFHCSLLGLNNLSDMKYLCSYVAIWSRFVEF